MNIPKGLRQRDGYWWMDFQYEGKRYRKTTGVPVAHDRRDENALIKAATSILDQARARVALGLWTTASPTQNKTFHQAVEKYEKQFLKQQKAKATIKSVLSMLDAKFGSNRLKDITVDMINDWKDECLEEGYAINTINRALALMRRIYKIAIDQWEWVQKNPATKAETIRGAKERDRWLTDEEEVRLLAACKPWFRDLVTFDIGTGLRRQEAIDLEWPDIDFQRRVVVVRDTKNKKDRTVPLNEKIIALLHGKSKIKSLLANQVFLKHGKKITNDNIWTEMHEAMEQAKITDLHFHDLRHTFATRLVQKGVDLYTVQKLLGHKNASMTQRYAHHSVDSLRNAVAML